MSRLTTRMKNQYLPVLILRDGGFNCFYCRCDLTHVNFVFEHLNDNPNYSDVANIVLACQSCNNKKKNDYDMQILAMEKLTINKKSNFSCEGEMLAENSPLSPEMESNQKNFDIIQQYLTEIIQTDGNILKKDAINSGAMLCKKKTGTGSQVSIRRYIEMLTSKEGPFMEVLNEEKTRIIVNRQGQ